MKKYKCLIFDFDGVICDSVGIKTQAFGSLYKKYGKDIVEKVKSYHLENGGISRFEKFKFISQFFLNISLTEDELNNLGNRFSKIVLEKIISTPLNPGVLEFLMLGKDSALQFICSGTPHEEMVYIIKEKKLDIYFEGVFGSPNSKKKIIIDILKKYNFFPHEVLFFGDSMTDYIAADETSIDFIGIDNFDTNFPKGTKIIKSFNELLLNG